MPLSLIKNSSSKGILVFCKGRNCKKSFVLIVENGIQRNVVPDDDIVTAFKVAFGDDYKEHILSSFGVYI